MPLSPGDKLGPYEILAIIGAGGMGEVWKARDTRLNRTVALKKLKGDHSVRFGQEARAVAALNHPHICQIFDVGPDYLVLEFIEGSPLRGPLGTERALALALEIADALEAAHKRGILHRDLKPANVLVTENGAKLLDFGLAKLTSETDATQTVEGAVLGTAAYMSPEQAQGKTGDERSDIFSFGALLYEVLSGRRAFSGGSMLQTLNAVVTAEPVPFESPLYPIVKRCLAKDPLERFQSAGELKAALAQISPKAANPAPSIAVLPLTNMSGDKEQEYFSDGLTEEIINTLVQIPGLKVIARTSAFAFKGQNVDIRKIAETLGVAHVLEGSVRRSANRIRVTAQLINAADGAHLWSQRYDRELTDVFSVQDEIAAAIAAALKLRFTAKSRHTPSLAAHEAYLRGLSLENSLTVESLGLARKCYEQAIALDPEYPDPHTGLASYYMMMNDLGAMLPRDAAGPGRAACERSLELDSSNALAHAHLAAYLRVYDHDWRNADRHLEIALSAEAIPAYVHLLAGIHHFCSGRFPEAIREMEWCIEKDPLASLYHSVFGWILVSEGSMERASVEVARALEIDPNFWMSHGVSTVIHLSAGRIEEAMYSAEQAARLGPWSYNFGILAAILDQARETQRAQEVIERLRAAPAHAVPSGMLFYHLVRKDLSAAAESYEKLIAYRQFQATLSIYCAWMAPLRASEYWPRLARLMNLPSSVQAM
jgi:eukaryotic-like serine/threonine-protein kinase